MDISRHARSKETPIMGHTQLTICHDIYRPMKMELRRPWKCYNFKL